MDEFGDVGGDLPGEGQELVGVNSEFVGDIYDDILGRIGLLPSLEPGKVGSGDFNPFGHLIEPDFELYPSLTNPFSKLGFHGVTYYAIGKIALSSTIFHVQT